MSSQMILLKRLLFILLICLLCRRFVTGLVRNRKSSSRLDYEDTIQQLLDPFHDELRSHHDELHSHHDEESSHVSKEEKDCSTCPGSDACVPLVQCPAHVRAKIINKPVIRCHLMRGREGICCSTGQNYTYLEDRKLRGSNLFDDKALQDAGMLGKRKFSKLMAKENETFMNNQQETMLSRHDPSFGHFQSQRTIDFHDAFRLNQKALQNLFTMQALKERQAIPNEDLSLGLHHIQLRDAPCPAPPDCSDVHVYRNIDGTCNNPIRHTWGAARTPYERLLPPAYEDGIWSPRGFSTLSSPRDISSVILPDKDRPHPKASLLTMQFGQFIAHDITGAVSLTHSDGSPVSCCTSDGKAPLPPKLQHLGCYPIKLSDEDDFYKLFGQRCMNFVRTQLAPNHDCSIGFAKQMNGVTHFLDLSHLYGSHADTLTELREGSAGRLKMFNDFGRDLCPLSNDKNDCITDSHDFACFKSGDGHGNQMITLVALHTLFSREHNRVAGILASLNPHWTDQLLFLEARKIVIAEYQHIIYNEWLPLILGMDTMENFDLHLLRQGYSNDYNLNINPSITNELSVAAFRFGHSTVDGKLKIPSNGEEDEKIAISELMFYPSRLRIREFYDRMLLGLTSQPMQQVDPSMTVQLTRYMFRRGNPKGLDLAALNIQRGRDHGLRSYNDYRELVGLRKIEDFDEFGPLISERLRKVYSSPHDVDLWIGGLLEAPVDDAVVGFTFREIIGDQFSRLKKGDRYFYDRGPDINPGHLTHEKLQEIRKTSMARIICDNSDHLELHHQSPLAFLLPHLLGNEPISCYGSHIPSVNFLPWKEF